MVNVDYKIFEAVADGRIIEDELRYRFGLKHDEIPVEAIEKRDWETVVETILNHTRYRLASVAWKGGCKASGYYTYHLVAEWE